MRIVYGAYYAVLNDCHEGRHLENNTMKFKNAIFVCIFCGCYATTGTIIICVIGFIGTYFFDGTRDFTWQFIGFGIAIAVIWLMVILAICCAKRVEVTWEAIIVYRGKKEKWRIQKSELQECIYTRLHWWHMIDFIGGITACELHFRPHGQKISKHYLMLSMKRVVRLRDDFGYPIRIIDTVYQK